MELAHSNMPLDVRVNHLGGRQFHVASFAQLRALGMNAGQVRRRVASGRFRMLMPNVVAIGAAVTDPGRDAWSMAGVLACGARSAICGPSAALRHGLLPRIGPEIHVISRSGHHPVATSPVRFMRRRTMSEQDCVATGGVATTTPARTIADLGAWLTEYEICAVMREAAFLGVFERAQIEHELNAIRVTGNSVVRTALQLFDAGCMGTRSWTEHYLVEGLRGADIPMPLVCNPRAIGFGGIEPDLAWPEVRLRVEVDGGSHMVPGQADKDRAQDDLLAAEMWATLRFTAVYVRRHRSEVIRTIERVYHERRSAPGPVRRSVR